MSRTKPPEERRADLLAAGSSLFVAKGIVATTLEEITREAGVSKGLFYQYFRSKDDLVFTLQEQFSNQFAERIAEAAAGQAGWADKLDACVEAAFECFRDLHELHEVLFSHGHAHAHGDPHGHAHGDPHGADGAHGDGADGPRHAPAHARLVDVLRQVLEDGVAAGGFDVEDPETTAMLFYIVMHSFDSNFLGSKAPSDDRLLRSTQALFRRTAGAA